MILLQKIEAALQANPSLGYVGSAGSLTIAAATSTYDTFVHHVDAIKLAFALAAAIFGALAGYYTFRIQRRNFKNLPKE